MENDRPRRRTRGHGWLFSGSAAIVLLLSLMSWAAAATSRPDDIGKIGVYAGAWKSRIVHYRTTYTKARIENLAVRNDCWRSSSYYVCDQFVNGKSAAFIVYTYNASQRLYHLQVISKDGNPPVSGVLTIEGNTWTFPWQYEDKGKVVFIRIVNVFPNRDTIDFHEGFSFDKVHWTATADGVERRAPSH
jgi:hypothetical protein